MSQKTKLEAGLEDLFSTLKEEIQPITGVAASEATGHGLAEQSAAVSAGSRIKGTRSTSKSSVVGPSFHRM